MTALGCTAPTTSAVPRVTTTRPGATTPAPSGLEKSSPVPTATGSARPEAGEGSAFASQRAGHRLATGRSRAAPRASMSNRPQSSGSRPPVPQVVEHAGGGDRLVQHRPAGQPRHQIGRRLMEAGDAAWPRDDGASASGSWPPCGSHPAPRPPLSMTSAGGNALELGAGAPVHPDEAGAQVPAPLASTGRQPSSWPAMPSAPTSPASSLASASASAIAGRRAVEPEPGILLGPERLREGRLIGHWTPRPSGLSPSSRTAAFRLWVPISMPRIRNARQSR